MKKILIAIAILAIASTAFCQASITRKNLAVVAAKKGGSGGGEITVIGSVAEHSNQSGTFTMAEGFTVSSGDSNRAIVVSVSYYTAPTPTITVSWPPGSTSSTLILKEESSSQGVQLFYIINPTAGTDTLEITVSGTTDMAVIAGYIKGATQANPTSTCGATANSNSITCDATATNATDYTFAAGSQWYEGTEGANQTLLDETTSAGAEPTGIISYEVGTGTRTMSYTWSGSDLAALAAMVVEAAE